MKYRLLSAFLLNSILLIFNKIKPTVSNNECLAFKLPYRLCASFLVQIKLLVMKPDHSSIFNIKNHDTKPVSNTNVGGFLNTIFNKIFITTHNLYKDPIIIYSSKDHLKVDNNKSFLSTFQNSIYEVVKSRTLAFELFLDESELVFMTDILHEHGVIKDYVVSLKTKAQEVRAVIFSAQIEIVNNKPYIRCALKEPVIN